MHVKSEQADPNSNKDDGHYEMRFVNINRPPTKQLL